MRRAVFRGCICAAIAVACAVGCVEPVRADMRNGTDLSTLTAAEFEGRPVIAFSAFDGPPGAQLSEIVIATPATAEPRALQDWSFHFIRHGLCADPNDGNIETMAFAKAGGGLALIFEADATQFPRATVVAWTPRYPQAASDWSLSFTGLDFPEEFGAAGTETFLALGYLTANAQHQAQVGVARASFPLPPDSSGWVKADVPVLVQGAAVTNSDYSASTKLQLVTLGGRLYGAGLLQTAQGLQLLLGVCADPLHDLAHWEFTLLQANVCESVALAADGSRLHLFYCQEAEPHALLAGACEADASLSPSAWKWTQVAARGGMVWGATADATSLGVIYDVWQPHSSPLKYACSATALPEAGRAQPWVVSSVPGLRSYLQLLELKGRPTIASFAYGDPGRVLYAWSKLAVPRTKRDWQVCPVYTGTKSGVAGMEEPAGLKPWWYALTVGVALSLGLMLLRRRRYATPR